MRQSTLPDALQRTPDLDRWLHIEDDGTITIFTGKVEIGQGIRTTVAQIAAEELDVSPERIRVVLADTARTPDEGYTAGSNSTQGSGGALRQVAAEVRAILLDMAAAQLGAPADRLRVDDGLSHRSCLRGTDQLLGAAWGQIVPSPGHGQRTTQTRGSVHPGGQFNAAH